MDITIKQENGVDFVTVEGKLTSVTAPILETELQTLESANLVLDFEKLDYISSSGLRVLLMEQKRINRLGGKLRVCHVNEMVLSVLQLSGFSEILTLE